MEIHVEYSVMAEPTGGMGLIGKTVEEIGQRPPPLGWHLSLPSASWCIAEEVVEHPSCQYKKNENSYRRFLGAELWFLDVKPFFQTFESSLCVIIGHDDPIKQN